MYKILIVSMFFCGCSSSISPTYLKETAALAIQDICKNEYNIKVKTKTTGSTLWIYMPVENIISKPDKPEKSKECFAIKKNTGEFKYDVLNFNYYIESIPETEKLQEISFNKNAMEKVNHVFRVISRVILSMDRTKKEPEFFCFIVADTQTGILLKQTFYYLDIKKVIYQFISQTEFQHRNIQDSEMAFQAIDNKEGLNLNYRDITMKEFIVNQIRHRIQLKFQKPEIGKNADIDKEIIKIIANTIKIYDFKDFSSVELNNLLTNERTSLNSVAIFASPID
ncbi:MAG: hypothetical protein QMD94_01320 [Candidatus Omnitrophota bacterium]|nr:hypothetical protein [Candidatus Omnitrophota bacterium]